MFLRAWVWIDRGIERYVSAFGTAPWKTFVTMKQLYDEVLAAQMGRG